MVLLQFLKTFEGDFFYAPIFIVVAAIFDSLDGRAARALGVGGGDFGKEVDSLCDMSSFGVAPAIMIYQYGMTELGYRWTSNCCLLCNWRLHASCTF